LAQAKNRVRIWTEFAIAYALVGLLCVLPLPAANALARTATHILDLFVPKLRRIALINLSFAFPDLSPCQRQGIADGVFRSIARLLVALSRFPKINKDNVHEWIHYEGLENYLKAKEKGRGVLVATAHFGNWELSAFAHALMTEPMHVMVRPLDNPLIDDLVESRRTLSGNHLIDKRVAARAVIKALRDNEAVGILIDQNTTPVEGVFVNFFGKLACASSAFVKLAHHSNAAVIPGFAIWDEQQGKYILRFYPQIPMTGDVAADTQQIHSTFERIMREHPDQWLWIHRRWKTRPPGEPPLY
jgi:Kdo2-lipid IVA lauroyltransferase/acyltransferase